MGSSMEQRAVADHHDQMVVNSSGSTQDLLNYLDEDVPGYSNYRSLHVIGLFAMAVFALPSNMAVIILLYRRKFWKSNVLLLLFQVRYQCIATTAASSDSLRNFGITNIL